MSKANQKFRRLKAVTSRDGSVVRYPVGVEEDVAFPWAVSPHPVTGEPVLRIVSMFVGGEERVRTLYHPDGTLARKVERFPTTESEDKRIADSNPAYTTDVHLAEWTANPGVTSAFTMDEIEIQRDEAGMPTGIVWNRGV